VEGCYAGPGRVCTTLPAGSPAAQDYIGAAQANGYQSLHTAVIAATGRLEVQIRTTEMHQVANTASPPH